MKLGIITDEISQDLAHALEVARAIGCSGVELRSMWDGRVDELSPRRVREVRSLLEQHSLECYDIAGPVFKCNLGSPREVIAHFDILKRCRDLAHSLLAPSVRADAPHVRADAPHVRADAPHVRAFTFWREPGVPLEAVWGKIVEQIALAAEIVAEAGLTLAVENEYSVYVGGGALLAKLLDEVEPPNVQAIWDPQNALFDPDAEPPYPDGYEAIKDKIAFCHIKDGVVTADGPKTVPVGDGDALLAELIARLKRDGYDGYLSLETHWRPEGARRPVGLDEAAVCMPGGGTFSGPSAEAGSRLCMANLQRLIEHAAQHEA
jgi:sugar phosphate isomerase/epimerase